MAIRFPGSVHEIATYGETFGGGTVGSPSIVDSAHLAYSLGISAVVAPSRYSEVRKVVFWFSIRHEHLASATVDQCQLEILPAVETLGGVDIAHFNLPPSTKDTLDNLLPVTAASVASIYGAPSDRNTFAPAAIGTTGTNGHSGLYFVQYDRFSNDLGSIRFFQDWDLISALSNDDEYVVYRPLLRRFDNGDGGTWAAGTGANAHPARAASFGVCIVQTGSEANDCCTYLGTGRPYVEDQSDLTIAFSTNTLDSGFFRFNADEWDGIASVHLMMIQVPNDGANQNGGIEHRIEKILANTTGPNTQLSTEEALGTNGTGTDVHIYRSKDLLADLEDGSDHVVNIRSTHATTPGDRPIIWWEIIQKACTKKVTRFMPHASHANAADVDNPPELGRGASLFDPLWFEDFADENFRSNLFFGSFFHTSAPNKPAETLVINALLNENPVTSSFNSEIVPEITATPKATNGYKLRRDAITSTDPINLAGKRQFILLMKGATRPGLVGLEYNIDLPDSETLNVGPIFALDEFNPEGCASTAAGLGDNPGVLAITNGSAPPKKFDPRSGLISNLGIQPPFEGELPQAIPEDTSASPEGGLELGTYVYRYTFRNSCTGKESDPNPEDIVVDTSGQSPAAKVTFSFAGVRITNDPQIDEICLYRTSEGGVFPVLAKVGCFSISSTTFVDTTPDEDLDFANEPLSLLNGPAPCAPVVAEFRNRLFLMGDIPSLSPSGTVDVTEGSDIVTFSVEAEVDRCMIGRFIQIEGDCKSYEIDSILPPVSTSPDQSRAKLTQPYEGGTLSLNRFTICGRPNRIYVSEPLEPDYWPASNFIDCEPGDGDRIMGAISNFNGLVICKRRKTYVLRFADSPALEVNVPARVSSDIGCIGPRTFAQIENGSVWLADRGIAIFDGRGVMHVPESSQVNDLLTDTENPRYVRRDRNGRATGAIGVFYPKRQQYLLLLPTVQTKRGANLMLVWDTTLKNITFYEFCQEFVSMEVAKDAQGNERVYLGDTNGFVWILDIGDTDGVGVPNATGTVRGVVSSAGVGENGASFLTDLNASFLVGGLPGAAGLSGVAGLSGFTGNEGLALSGVCVFVRQANAPLGEPWVSRTIFASTQKTLYVSPSWGDDTPESGYEYMIGPIEFLAEFKPRNYDTDDFQKRDWQQVVTHVPETVASELRIELIPDQQESDPEEGTVVDPVTEAVGKGRVFRMDHSTGRQVSPVGRFVHNFMQVRLSNFAPEEPIRVLNQMLRITPKVSR